MFYLDPNKQGETATQDWPLTFARLEKQAKNPLLKNYYAAGVISGDTPLSQVPFLSVDIETTGLCPKKNGILSIGALPFNLERIRCKDAKHWFVNPRTQVGDASMVIHGITHSQIAAAPDLQVHLAEMLELFSGKILLVHCRSIERGFLDAAVRTRLNEGLEFPVVDTMELEARIHRQKPVSWLAKLLGRKPPSIRLAACRERYGLPAYQPHDALTDALATAELFQAQIAYHYSPDTPLKEVWK
ncbi:3'-5' exonuclease [Marinospirillum insulare]|uniref:3'-5' exonuclease n=1 Tax=Marinospirillum insulare TaxID=217169 RepID=A0ABQ5ZXR1_9GAMM|nr:3'-5' exonuclease [Marinospirillum insulare]GLR64789.1 3'-5' exonuclease [Marinospirillum insulare]